MRVIPVLAFFAICLPATSFAGGEQSVDSRELGSALERTRDEYKLDLSKAIYIENLAHDLLSKVSGGSSFNRKIFFETLTLLQNSISDDLPSERGMELISRIRRLLRLQDMPSDEEVVYSEIDHTKLRLLTLALSLAVSREKFVIMSHAFIQWSMFLGALKGQWPQKRGEVREWRARSAKNAAQAARLGKSVEILASVNELKAASPEDYETLSALMAEYEKTQNAVAK